MSRETPEQRAERILAELRAATTEAAGVLKDLQHAIKSARATVEQYTHDEVQKSLDGYTAQWQQAADGFHAEMKADITEHITGWTAVLKNDISRTAIFKEAVDAILAELQNYDHNRLARAAELAPNVTVSLCDRPHAD